MTWREAFRAFLQLLTPEQLELVHFGLATDDRRLLQRTNTEPVPLHALRHRPCDGACLMGYALLGEKQSAFAVENWLLNVSLLLTPPVFAMIASRWDYCPKEGWPVHRPREEAIAEFLPEVRRFIEERAA